MQVPPEWTTHTCSRCGHVKEGEEKLTLSDRVYHCPECGLILDCDLNAATNIHRAGLARIHACGDDVRPSIEDAVVAEAGAIWSARD